MNSHSARNRRSSFWRWIPVAVTATCTLLVAIALGCAMSDDSKPAPSSERELQAVSDLAENTTPYEAADESDAPNASDDEAPAAADPELISRLNSEVQALSTASGMETCVAIVDLQSGSRAGYLADTQITSASMIKLAIAYAFLERVADGTYSLDGYYTIQSSDIVGGTGTLGSLGAGAQVTYRELLAKMINVSDNVGTNILIDAVGMDAVNETARDLGLTATQLNRHMMDSDAMAQGIENYTSANDVAALLEMAYDGTFVDADCSALVMQALEEQQDYGGILGGLPAGVTFAHKTGTLGTVRHDGGIVESERPFVLVVLCGGNGFYESGALSAMAQIAEAVYGTLAA